LPDKLSRRRRRRRDNERPGPMGTQLWCVARSKHTATSLGYTEKYCRRRRLLNISGNDCTKHIFSIYRFIGNYKILLINPNFP